jgi:hypothetical protein
MTAPNRMAGAAALIMAAMVCPAADTYRVAGVVVNALTDAPLPRVTVIVLPTGTSTTMAEARTGEDGRFNFVLPAGKYDLRAGQRDLSVSYGRQSPSSALGTSVVVGPDQATADLIFRWFPHASITGRVLDQDGEPVEDAWVQLLHSIVVGGRRRIIPFAFERTNDLGEYSFGPIHAGTYYLAATGRPWYASNVERPSDDPNPLAGQAYYPAYYPGTRDVEKAGPLVVQPGEEARADFRLALAQGANIAVEIKGENRAARVCRMFLVSDGIAGAQNPHDIVSGNAGLTVLHAVPPGRYNLHYICNTPNVLAQKQVNVSGNDLKVELVPRPPPSLSGSIHLRNGAARPKGSVVVTLYGVDDQRWIGTASRPDGSFSFAGVLPGRYRPTVRGTDGYFVAEVQAEGTSFQGGILDLKEGETVTLRIVAGDEVGRLKGYVLNGDQRQEGAMVVLCPVKERGDGWQSRGFQSDSDGSFDFERVPAGDYWLFAVTDPEFEYGKAEATRRYLSRAKAVRIDAQGNYNEDIQLLTPIRN